MYNFHSRHYQVIAEQIKSSKKVRKSDTAAVLAIMDIQTRLADVFTQDNPRFDREKFNEACSMKETAPHVT